MHKSCTPADSGVHLCGADRAPARLGRLHNSNRSSELGPHDCKSAVGSFLCTTLRLRLRRLRPYRPSSCLRNGPDGREAACQPLRFRPSLCNGMLVPMANSIDSGSWLKTERYTRAQITLPRWFRVRSPGALWFIGLCVVLAVSSCSRPDPIPSSPAMTPTASTTDGRRRC